MGRIAHNNSPVFAGEMQSARMDCGVGLRRRVEETSPVCQQMNNDRLYSMTDVLCVA